MPPKKSTDKSKDAKGNDKKGGAKDKKGKDKKKVFPGKSALGMGGTIGLMEKPVRACLTNANKCQPPCPPPPPPQCCPQYSCYPPPGCPPC